MFPAPVFSRLPRNQRNSLNPATENPQENFIQLYTFWRTRKKINILYQICLKILIQKSYLIELIPII